MALFGSEDLESDGLLGNDDILEFLSDPELQPWQTDATGGQGPFTQIGLLDIIPTDINDIEIWGLFNHRDGD